MTEVDHTKGTIQFLNRFGLDAKLVSESTQIQADCPFCGKKQHMYVAPETFMWDCKVCGKAGNAITFFTQISTSWPKLHPATEEQWRELSRSRGDIPVQYFKRAGLFCVIGVWVMPDWSESGTVRDLRWWLGKKLMSTPGCKTQLWGARELAKDEDNQVVYVCEGEWDAIAMTWLLDASSQDGIVVAVPGANTLKSDWADMFKDKNVVTMYDLDDAGAAGRARCEKILGGQVKSMKHVMWPATLPSGFDLRDFVCAGMREKSPADLMVELMKLTVLYQRKLSGQARRQAEKIDPISWTELLMEFKAKLRMTPDMIDGLRVSVATVMSAPLPGDPLWVYLVGPPGAGKTAILGSMGTSPRCVLRSSLTAHSLISGWRGEQGDPSLIPKLAGLALVCKDFTEVISMPSIAQDEIFSTLRGAYDGTVVKTFGNGVQREYNDCHFSLVAGVTSAIHACKTATLGERFLKFQIVRQSGREADDLVRAAMSSVGKEKQLEEALQTATMRFLERVPDALSMPLLPSDLADRLMGTVQLVAFLRATVSRDQRSDIVQFRPVPEAGTRLAKQLAKMSMMLAFVEGRNQVSESDFRLVERIARDTSGGFALDIVEALQRCGGEATKSDLEGKADLPHGTVYKYVEDMQVLGILQVAGKIASSSGRPSLTYKLTSEVHRLWQMSRGEVSWPKKLSIKPATRPSQRLTLRRSS